MGIFQEVKCPSCRRAWKIRTGHGRAHGMLNRVMEVFPAGMQDKIHEDLNGESAPLFDFNFHMAACRQCRSIVAVPVLRLLETGQSYSSGCPNCGSRVEFLNENALPACPNCQQKGLTLQDIGHWD